MESKTCYNMNTNILQCKTWQQQVNLMPQRKKKGLENKCLYNSEHHLHVY